MKEQESPNWSPDLPVPTGQDLEPPAKPKAEMPFLDHLEELRWRLLKSISAIVVAAAVCFTFSGRILEVLTYPYHDAVQSLESSNSLGFVTTVRDWINHWDTGTPVAALTDDALQVLPTGRKLQFLKPMSAFFMGLQIALMGGVVVALPIVFFQLWRFLAPGLLAQEKQLVLPIVALSVVCFLIGATIAYSVVLPIGLRFFLSLEPANMTSQWAADEYIGFVIKLLTGFGIVFEMPVLALFLSRAGLLTPTYLRRVRRYAIIIIFVLAAFFTPPDPVSQILMALPLLILYEVSIWVSRVANRDKQEKTQ